MHKCYTCKKRFISQYGYVKHMLVHRIRWKPRELKKRKRDKDDKDDGEPPAVRICLRYKDLGYCGSGTSSQGKNNAWK